MEFNEALKILGLELGRGDKVRVNPFEEIALAYEVWHESAIKLNRASTPSRMSHHREIERADWQIVLAWGVLSEFYCWVCGYVVSPKHYHHSDCKHQALEENENVRGSI